MKIIIELEGYLKNIYPVTPIELNFSKEVTIRKILEEAKINFADIFFIKLGDEIVKEDYLVTKSNTIKLFPIIIGGGY